MNVFINVLGSRFIDNLLKIIVMEVGTFMCMSGHPYICAVCTIISSSFSLYVYLSVSINDHTSARISQARHLIEGHRCFAHSWMSCIL